MSIFHFKPFSFVKKDASQSFSLISKPNAPFHYVEAYNALRTNLNFISTENNAHSFVVASAIPNENASNASLNLAISLASEKKRVIIVDCDLRKPALQQALHLESCSTGLAHVLTGKATLEKAICNCESLNLSVLVAGDVVANPSTLFDQDAMKAIVETLKSQFDYVILNAPPVSVVTDASILGQYVDGALLVVRSRFAPREAVLLAKHKLDAVHVKIFGVILTEFNIRKINKSSGYSHMHRYQY